MGKEGVIEVLKISEKGPSVVRTVLMSVVGAKKDGRKVAGGGRKGKKHKIDSFKLKCDLWRGIRVYLRKNKGGLYLELRIPMEE